MERGEYHLEMEKVAEKGVALNCENYRLKNKKIYQALKKKCKSGAY